MSGRNKLRVAGCMLLVEYKNYPPHGGGEGGGN